MPDQDSTAQKPRVIVTKNRDITVPGNEPFLKPIPPVTKQVPAHPQPKVNVINPLSLPAVSRPAPGYYPSVIRPVICQQTPAQPAQSMNRRQSFLPLLGLAAASISIPLAILYGIASWASQRIPGEREIPPQVPDVTPQFYDIAYGLEGLKTQNHPVANIWLPYTTDSVWTNERNANEFSFFEFTDPSTKSFFSQKYGGEVVGIDGRLVHSHPHDECQLRPRKRLQPYGLDLSGVLYKPDLLLVNNFSQINIFTDDKSSKPLEVITKTGRYFP